MIKLQRNARTVLVIGTGTIGEPLIGLLADIKREFQLFGEIIFFKNTPRIEDRPKVQALISRGALLCARKEVYNQFSALGLEPAMAFPEALRMAQVIIDCTPEGIALENKRSYYEPIASQKLGFIAQGSEDGFGVPFVFGINDAVLKPEDRFIQVLSCNTHNIAVLVSAIALAGNRDNLVSGRFVCVRRDSDISQNEDSVPAPTVSRHNDPQFGTHHARDAHFLFKTLGLELNLFSSAMKVNTQYMHAIWFDLLLRDPIALEKVQELLLANERIAVTYKKSANLVFAFGREHGHYGRLLSNTVVVWPSLTVRNGNEVIGFCFTPQDGNSLLSSLAAVTRFFEPERYPYWISSILERWNLLFKEV